LLEAVALSVALPDRAKKPLFGNAPLLHILHDVNLTIAPGEAVGIVGESGSGKSTLGRTFLRIYRPATGQVLFEGRDLALLNTRELRDVRLRLQMIFQDSTSSLNPRSRIIDALSTPLVAHKIASRSVAQKRAFELLERVGLNASHAYRYPHELSGGQRQRVGIARAIAFEPAFLIADEIVSGLDVSVQAQVLHLLRRLRSESRMGMVFISHDLSVVRTLCDRVAVMQSGRIVETGACSEIFVRPRHPYTQALLRAIPLPVVDRHWLDADTHGAKSSAPDDVNYCREGQNSA
jgi:peptide/nickel transport system ATP-binding protein